MAVREVDARGAAVSAGASSTATWLQSVVRERPGSAKRVVRLAHGLAERYAATAAALAAGTISADHAAVICSILDGLPFTMAPAVIAEAEATLLAHAAIRDPLTLSKLGRHLAYVLDPDGEKALAAQEARLDAGRELFLSQADDGFWHLRARFDPMGGAKLWSVVDALSAPAPSTEDGPDPRTAPQRRADGMIRLCEMQIENPDLPTRGGEQATVFVVTTLEGLEGRLGAAAPSFVDGAPISVAMLRRTACDAKVIPVVMGGESQPLDLGRSRYTVPAPLRRAVLLRDGHRCVVDGCPNFPRHCHHICPWYRLGETKLDNLASLCGHHHRWIHHGREDWILPVPGGKPMIRAGPAP